MDMQTPECQYVMYCLLKVCTLSVMCIYLYQYYDVRGLNHTSAIHCWPPSICCARPMVWNSLPDDLRAQQNSESFRQRLKTWLFSSY